ncbi:MAG: formate dehydrogenase subunit delta [Phyllobacteriaceae bacterium]|nr:formate dehydrogenase subunit delta [Phyllobacteriaceae bacterium]
MWRDKIVTMANQIATFFASAPREEGVAGLAEHINNFWDPRMRAQLFAAVEDGAGGLQPLVLEAAARIRRPPIACRQNL